MGQRANPMTIRTITVPVKDLDAATALYRSLLGTDPYMQQPYYVGFRPEGSPEIGLDPPGDVAGGAITHFPLGGLAAAVTTLTGWGASPERSAHDVGGGNLTATLRD